MRSFYRINNEDPMMTLCRMATETNYDDLPKGVTDFGKKLILDILGVTIAGSSQEAIDEVVDFVKNHGGRKESFLPFYGGRVPASMAAFALGPMARAIDMGDCHEIALHSSEYVFPALLAATGLKPKVRGKEFITAFVVGEEILIRIGEANKVVELAGRDHGSIEHGGHYIFGAVAAVGKLLGLNLEELENAMGIAVAMTQPHDLLMYGGTMGDPPNHMVRIHHGFVCQDAVNICLLAKRGITGPHNIMLGREGYLDLYDKEGSDPEKLTIGLGEDWRMTTTMIKPYAHCKCTHTTIDGVVALINENKFGPEDIEKIHVDMTGTTLVSVAQPKEVRWNPHTPMDCQFSLPYAVATAVYDKDVFLDSYTDKAMKRKGVRDLMTRVSADDDKGVPEWGARVTVTLKDGRKLSKEVLYVKGHVKRPFTLDELITKFKRLTAYSAYKLKDATVNTLVQTVLKLEEVEDVVKNIVIPLTPRNS